ncbi:MAG: ABC transporter permease subunit [Thaumarchaeota archaeon]|nr:ABC transporter permease subunit [Nitrososphaerota archaeon]
MLRYRSKLVGMLPIAGVLVIWQLISQFGIVPALYLPSVTAIVYQLYLSFVGGNPLYAIPSNFAFTIQRMMISFFIASIFGVTTGLLLGLHKRTYLLFETLIEVFRAMPGVVLIPFFILIVGINDEMYIAFIAFATVWPVLINTIDGAKSIEPLLFDVAKSLKIVGLRRFVKITIPAASPYIVSGLRIALLLSLLITIAVEFVVGRNGLGWSIIFAQQEQNIRLLYAELLLLALTGYLLNEAFALIENRLMKWHIQFSRGLTQA